VKNHLIVKIFWKATLRKTLHEEHITTRCC